MDEALASLDDAFGGRGRLLLLAGEPGIGKSRFAEEVAARAVDRGATVLWGRCWEAGGAPAYWPWSQALRTLTQALDAGPLRALLGARAADIAQMLPELREAIGDVPSPPALDPESARFRLFDATASFLSSASSEGLLVVVLDDLQAAPAGMSSRNRLRARESRDRTVPIGMSSASAISA